MQREIEARGGHFVQQGPSGTYSWPCWSYSNRLDYFIDFPSKSEDMSGSSVRVSYMWLERCIEDERIVDPKESPLFTPFASKVRPSISLSAHSTITEAAAAGRIQGHARLPEQL